MLQLSLDFLGKQIARFKPAPAPRPRRDQPWVWKHDITVQFVFQPRARRYLLRLQPDGTARLVIPRRGSQTEGLRFLERSESWLLKRQAQWKSQSAARQPWIDGASFLFRGEEVRLRVENGERGATLRFSDQILTVPHALPCYRQVVLAHLRRMAECELPMRTRELARHHGIAVHRVSVRAQKTRWGSCSTRGTISLNWRLIHTPSHLVDYLIIHELMHRRQMNHSARYWKLVAEACPGYRDAERWLKSTRIEMMP